MDTKKLREEFFQFSADKYGHQSTRSYLKRQSTVWNKIRKWEEETGQQLENLQTHEQFLAFFRNFPARHYYTFNAFKAQITDYFRFLVDHKVVPRSALVAATSVMFDSIYEDGTCNIPYFRNILEVRFAIDTTISNAPNVDPTVYDTPALALYLAWYGLSWTQIISIRKEDVTEDGIMIDGQLLSLPGYVMDVALRYRYAVFYEQSAKGIIRRYYKDSVWLFRSAFSDHLTEDSLPTTVSRFNAIRDGKYNLTYKIVRDSGIYNRAMLRETQRRLEGAPVDFSDFRELSFLFEQDIAETSLAYSRLNEYESYKTLF